MRAAALLPRIPDMIGSPLSASERDYADEAEAREREARKSALAIHDHAAERAQFARTRLLAMLPKGNAMEFAKIAAAIDAHARAQSALRESAQGVCDILELPDFGKAAGVTWETPLGGAR